MHLQTHFSKKYATADEEHQKSKIFKENADKIAKHNELYKQGKVSFEMAMNKFGDMVSYPHLHNDVVLMEEKLKDALEMLKELMQESEETKSLSKKKSEPIKVEEGDNRYKGKCNIPRSINKLRK